MSAPQDADARETRWRSEASFFDREAESMLADVQPLDPLVIARYSNPNLKGITPREFGFKIMRGLAGKKILEPGCGCGANSSLLAKLGAHVTGIDISPKSIELARRRAEINGVAGRVDFRCSPMELISIPDNTFDIVWCEAFLHHLIEDLPVIVEHLRRWVKPDGLIVILEPVTLNMWLRRMRLQVPVELNGTPDERPLESAEITQLRHIFASPKIEHFRILGRLDRFILPNYNYEHAPAWRKTAFNSVSRIDSALMVFPGLNRFSSNVVMYGAPRK